MKQREAYLATKLATLYELAIELRSTVRFTYFRKANE
jgi:hypothetical protein